MSGEILKIVVRISITGLIISGLLIIGNVIDNLVVWSWLTDVFSLIKKSLNSLNFIIDINTLITLVGYSLTIGVGYWSFRIIIWLSKYFNEK